MNFAQLIMQAIQPSIEQIDAAVIEQHPIILADMAQELFAQQGAFNGRNRWEDNTESTAKRKGGNSPNIETGFLEDNMTKPGFLENDNWLDSIKPPKKKDGNYNYADKMRKFSDIGQTSEDDHYMSEELAKAIRNELSA